MIAALSFLGSALGSSGADQTSHVIGKTTATNVAGVAGADFGQVLADASANAVDALKFGEAASIAGIQGKATVQQVVQSVMTAEQSLHTAVAIRDKIVAAYQTLTQMGI